MAIALTFIFALLFSAMFGWQFFNSTVAVQLYNSSTIQIEKPNSSVIYGNSVPLTFNVSHYLDLNGYAAEFSVLWRGYSLDDMTPINITSIPDTGWMSGKSPPFQTALFPFEVPDGIHKIEVMVQGYFINELRVYRYKISSIPIYFTVDTAPPVISSLSPENKTFDTIDVSLNFAVDKPTFWIGYTLDGKGNVTVDGNIPLTGLSYASHTLTIYANDGIGNVGASVPVTFTVAEPAPPEPTTTFAIEIVVPASEASVAVVGIGPAGLLQEKQTTKQLLFHHF